jgi:hypothetical protein
VLWKEKESIPPKAVDQSAKKGVKKWTSFLKLFEKRLNIVKKFDVSSSLDHAKQNSIYLFNPLLLCNKLSGGTEGTHTCGCPV